MNKYLPVVILLILFSIPTVMAFDESIVKTKLRIVWKKQDTNEGTIFLEPVNEDTAVEGGKYAKTILFNTSCTGNVSDGQCQGGVVGIDGDFSDEIGVVMSKRFGNYTEAQYNIMRLADQVNYSRKWRECIDRLGNLSYNMKEDYMKEAKHENITTNLTDQIDDLKQEKEQLVSQKEELNKKKDDAQGNKQTWMLAGLVGWIVALYFGYKYTGWFKRKQTEEKELPKDTSQ